MQAIPHPSRVQLSVSLTAEQAELAVLALEIVRRLHEQQFPQLHDHIQDAARFIPIDTLPDLSGLAQVFERICDPLFEYRYWTPVEMLDINELPPGSPPDDFDNLLIQQYEAEWNASREDL